MAKSIYIGRYNSWGYAVFNMSAGDCVYTAGNSPYDSQVYTTPEFGLSLATMREFCEQTTREIAKENGGNFDGVELDDSNYPPS